MENHSSGTVIQEAEQKCSCWEIEMQKANRSRKHIIYMQLLVLILAIPIVPL